MASGIPRLMVEESIFPSNTGEGFQERPFIHFGLYLWTKYTVQGRSTQYGQLGTHLFGEYKFTLIHHQNLKEGILENWNISTKFTLLAPHIWSATAKSSTIYLFVQLFLSNSTAIDLIQDPLCNLPINLLATANLSIKFILCTKKYSTH